MSDELPHIRHTCVIGKDELGAFISAGETEYIRDSAASNYDAKVAMASAVLVSMEQVSDTESAESFVRDVVEDYNSRRKTGRTGEDL